MVQSAAPTVAAYLADLDDDRRAMIATVRRLVKRSLPTGYVETMQYGMISWVVPPRRMTGPTYNGQPLAIVSLAAQKNGLSLYLMGAYTRPAVDRALRDAYAAAGVRLAMGKSCLRFKHPSELLVDAVAAAIAAVDVDAFIASHDAVRAARATPKKTAGKTAKKTAKKKTAR